MTPATLPPLVAKFLLASLPSDFIPPCCRLHTRRHLNRTDLLFNFARRAGHVVLLPRHPRMPVPDADQHG